MPDGQRVDVGLRGAARGMATVVLAACGYLMVLSALAWLAAWILRVA